MIEPQIGRVRTMVKRVDPNYVNSAQVALHEYDTLDEAVADLPRLQTVCENYQMEEAL